MKAVTKPGDNLGGLLKIWAVPSNVISVNNGVATISDSSNVYALYCSPDSMDFREQKEKTDAGTVYNTTVAGLIPGNATDLQEALDYIEPRKWVVIFQDGNGQYMVAGDATYPLRAAGELATGKATSERYGCQMSFTGKTLARAKAIANPF